MPICVRLWGLLVIRSKNKHAIDVVLYVARKTLFSLQSERLANNLQAFFILFNFLTFLELFEFYTSNTNVLFIFLSANCDTLQKNQLFCIFEEVFEKLPFTPQQEQPLFCGAKWKAKSEMEVERKQEHTRLLQLLTLAAIDW